MNPLSAHMALPVIWFLNACWKAAKRWRLYVMHVMGDCYDKLNWTEANTECLLHVYDVAKTKGVYKGYIDQFIMHVDSPK